MKMFSRLDKSLTIVKYHGKGRNLDDKQYLNCNIVFTTYHTIAASMNQSDSVVFRIAWFRIVLDEGRRLPQLTT